MSEVYSGWVRTRTPEGYSPPADLMRFARKAMGALLAGVKAGHLGVATRRHELLDGSRVTVSWDGTTPVIDIEPADSATTGSDSLLAGLWIPRGFVTRPAWRNLSSGVGLPVVPSAHADNLNPGTDPARWTPGGPCGQLLLTRDADAGYPKTHREPVPLMYDKAAGPFITAGKAAALAARKWEGPWQAFRMSWEAPVAYYPDETLGLNQALVAAVNAARTKEGVLPPPDVYPGSGATSIGTATCNAWPRGWYRPALVTAYLMQANGVTAETSAAYPPTYRTLAARLNKDGYARGLGTRAPPVGWTGGRADTYGACELRGKGSAQAMVAKWLASETDRPRLLASYDAAPFVDAGNCGGFAAAVIEERVTWIQAGNAVWQCDSARALPPLSWCSYASMKLYWETWPVDFDYITQQLTAARFDPAHPGVPAIQYATGGGSTTAYQLGIGAIDGVGFATLIGALDCNLFMYGRAIALAPGLVWAAGILAHDDKQRLIALVHQHDDQPSSWHDGLTRYLRVWWVDLPPDGLLGRPGAVICGTDPADPYGWHGGQIIDVGVIPHAPTDALATGPGVVNALKYDSVWRFSPDGSKAACLRDFFSFAQHTTAAQQRYEQSTEAVQWGGFPLPLELFFSVALDGELLTTVHWHDWPASSNRAVASLPGVSPYMGTVAGQETLLREFAPTPMAVDYDANGVLRAAYVGNFTYTPSPYMVGATLIYTGVAAPGAVWTSDLDRLMLLSCDVAIPELDFEWNNVPQVLDVIDAVFVSDGMHPKDCFPADYATTGAIINPSYSPQKQSTMGVPVHGVHLSRQGVRAALDWYPCNDSTVWQHTYFCGVHMLSYPTDAAENVQGRYVRYRGEWLMSYQLAPQGRLRVVQVGITPTYGTCGNGQTDTNALASARLYHYNDYDPRGGRQFASFILPSAAGDWSIEATVV